jgi:N-formylglutamate deformylase
MASALGYRFEASDQSTPVLVSVPHAGISVPDIERKLLSATEDTLLRDADLFVDRLYANAPRRGASLVAAEISRYVVDLNRATDDVDREAVPEHPSPKPELPRGLIWRLSTEGKVVLTRPMTMLEYHERLARYYHPYQNKIAEELTARREKFGYAILIDGHSMPSVGRAGHTDPGRRRADVVPGVRGGTSCARELQDLVVSHFKSAGLSVAVDDPYKGGNITATYGKPKENWHTIQIELNRDLYMDEVRCVPKDAEFRALATILEGLVERVSNLKLSTLTE